jgi:DNA polymerase III subunit chi
VTDIGFYHLTKSPLERALPQILEKALASGKRTLVRAGSEERVAFLNNALWTYDPASFLPHGTVSEGDPSDHPILLTASDDNTSGAEILVLTDGAEAPDLAAFERCLEMFDGKDQAAVEVARGHWKSYKEQGFPLTYWQQSETGGWEKKTEG